MYFNKKTRAYAACLLLFIILLMMSGCIESVSQDFSDAITASETGLYIKGNKVELDVPQSGLYFYNQLTEVQKVIYSASLIALENESNVYELVGVDCDAYADGCKRATEALMRDHPEFFWIDGGNQVKSTTVAGSAGGTVEIILRIYDYWNGKSISKARNELDEAIESVVMQADNCESDFEKALWVNDWLVNNVEYDFESFDFPSGMDDADRAFVNSMYGTLVAGKTLCGGYACTYSYILNRLGIDTLYVTGTTIDGLHAWNQIKLGDEYYHIDVTWADDNKNGRTFYTYFGLDDAEMMLTHHVDDIFSYPSATGIQYNYYRQKGLYMESYSFNKFNSIFSLYPFEGDFSIKFPNEVVLKAAVVDIIENAKFYKLDQLKDNKAFSYSVDEIHCILTLFQ